MEKKEKIIETAERLWTKIKKGRSCTALIPAVVVAVAAASLVGTYHPKVFESLASELSQVEAAEAAKEAEGLLELPEQESQPAETEDEDVSDAAAYKDGTYYGEAQGYGGITKVKVVITDGKIAGIEIVSHHDDSPYIDNAKALIDQIIGGQTTQLDTVSGATYSSKGILNAVRKALAQAATDPSQVEAVTDQAAPKKKTPSGSATISKVEDADGYKDGTYYGTGQGYGGTTKVKVVISGGEITDIEVVSHNDDSPYIGNAKTLISKIISSQSTNVDAVSGATYSSRGIINAVRSALSQAEVTSGGTKSGGSSAGTNAEEEKILYLTDDDLDLTPDIDAGAISGSGYKDGTYTGEGEGYGGITKVQVVISGGKISGIKVLSHEDDSPYIDNAKALISKIISGQTIEVDTVSGATYSSRGIIEAVYQALKQAVAENESDSGDKADNKEPESPEKPSGSGSSESKVYTVSASEHVYRTQEDDEDESEWDEYGVTVTLEVQDGVFRNITVTPDESYDESQNKAYMRRATTGKAGIITKLLGASAAKETVESWDVMTGATRTSTAIRTAALRALEELEQNN